MQLTVYSGLPEEYVHNGDVLFVGVVVHLALMSILICDVFDQHTLVSDDMSSLSPIEFGYFGLSGPVVFLMVGWFP